MKNLEQLRAAAALVTAEQTTKAAVSKLPAMILTNGFLAAAAFASEKKEQGSWKRPEMKSVFDGVALHLANPLIGIPVLAGCKTSEDMTKALAKSDSIHLQRATSEALAFIGYVKRFTLKAGDEDKRD